MFLPLLPPPSKTNGSLGGITVHKPNNNKHLFRRTRETRERLINPNNRIRHLQFMYFVYFVLIIIIKIRFMLTTYPFLFSCCCHTRMFTTKSTDSSSSFSKPIPLFSVSFISFIFHAPLVFDWLLFLLTCKRILERDHFKWTSLWIIYLYPNRLLWSSSHSVCFHRLIEINLYYFSDTIYKAWMSLNTVFNHITHCLG